MSIKVESTTQSPVVARTADAAGASVVSRAGMSRSGPVAATAAIDTLAMTSEATVLKSMESGLASDEASFDAAKVEALRNAIADGSYRIDADAIAGRMVDIELELFA